MGNKLDLISDKDQSGLITQMRDLQENFDTKVLSYFTSALTGENVQQLFEDVCKSVHNERKPDLRKSSIYLGNNKKEKDDQYHCCST